jgi:hypothetical protein
VSWMPDSQGVAIVGAGPAGLVLAHQLVLRVDVVRSPAGQGGILQHHRLARGAELAAVILDRKIQDGRGNALALQQPHGAVLDQARLRQAAQVGLRLPLEHRSARDAGRWKPEQIGGSVSVLPGVAVSDRRASAVIRRCASSAWPRNRQAELPAGADYLAAPAIYGATLGGVPVQAASCGGRGGGRGGLRKVPGDFPLGFAALAALVSERPGRAGAVGVEEDIR